MTKIYFLLALTPVYCKFLFAQGTWTQMADFTGQARCDGFSFSIEDTGYIGCGWNTVTYFFDFWAYDKNTDSWSQKSDYPGLGGTAGVGFSIGNKGYAGTGKGGFGYSNDFWEYDPVANTWSQKADFGGTARIAAVGFSIGDKGYVGTGNDGVLQNDFWEYSQSLDAWVQKTNFGGTARYSSVAFSIGMKGYLGSGYASTYEYDFWEWDQATDSWTKKADLSAMGRSGACGFAIDGMGYVGFGWNGMSFLKDFWKYNPDNDSWSSIAAFSGWARGWAESFVIGKCAFVGIGWDGGAFNDLWKYNTCAAAIGAQNITCYGGNDGIAFASFACEGTSPYTFNWSTGQTTSTISELDIGTYYITISDAAGCTGYSSATITEPSAPLSVIKDSVAPGITVTGGTPPYTYLWSTGDTIEDIIITSDTAIVAVTDSNGCSVTFTYVGFYDLSSPDNITIYPNPTNGSFSINYEYMNSISEILIRDFSGKTVCRKDLSSVSSSKKYFVTGLESGMYFLEINSRTGRRFQKVLIY